MRFVVSILLWACLTHFVFGQSSLGSISGEVRDAESGQTLIGATVQVPSLSKGTSTDAEGKFVITDVPHGNYDLVISYIGKQADTISISVPIGSSQLSILLENSTDIIDEIIIEDKNDSRAITRLRNVENAAIYAAKKTEVVEMSRLTANKAANVSRQIYSRIAGLNIWESDGAGVQLGIGGRGLSPNRNANFNTRQSGYDISADALGYPESYYTPPAEAIRRIQVVRGAASLQYGTQFGGMVNFLFHEGPRDKKIELTSRLTGGSFDFLNTFNSVGGTIGKVNYYGFYQYKRSGGWRPNSSLHQHNAFVSVNWQPSENLSLKGEYTYSNYLAQQPGGLTDAEFEMNPRQSKRERNWFAVDWNLFALEWNYKVNDQLTWNNRFFGLIGGRDALGNLQNINLLDFGENRDLLKDDFQNYGNESRLLYRYQTNGNPSTLLIGMRYYNGLTDRRQGEGSDGSDPDFRYLNPENVEGSDFILPSRNYSIFAENVFTLSQQWSIVPGARFEYISTTAEGYYREIARDLAGNIINDNRIEETRSNDRSFLFFGVGASYKPSSETEIYVNLSQNYRAINFNDIRVNVGSLVVDEDLSDERGFTSDIGIRGRLFDVLSYDQTVYHISYQDRIGTILKKEPNPVFNGLVDRVIRFRSNIADASIFGLESMIDVDVWKLLGRSDEKGQLSLFSNFAYTMASYSSDDSAINGNDVELVPSVLFKTGVNVGLGAFSCQALYSYTAEHFSDASNAIRTPSAIEGIIPSYSILDVSMSYTFAPFVVEAGVNNVLDNNYFTRRATGYPGPGIIPSDGRSLYLTLQFTIGK